MASIIPRIRENVRIQPSSPVPVGSGDFARRQGEGLERVGGQIMDIGQAMFKADAIAKESGATSEINSLTKESEMYAQKMSKADGSDVKQKFQEHYDSKIGEIREKYGGNFVASKKIAQYEQLRLKEEDNQLFGISVGKLQTYTADAVVKSSQDAITRVYNNPDPALLASEITRMNKEIDGYTKISQETGVPALTTETAQKLKDAFYTDTAKNMMRGMIDRQQYGKALGLLGASQQDMEEFNEFTPDMAKQMGFITDQEARTLADKGERFKVPTMTKKDKAHTKLTPEEALVMRSLNDDQRASMTQQIKAKMKERTELRLSDLNAEINAIEFLGENGSLSDGARINKVLGQINSNPDLPPVAKGRLAHKVLSAKAMSEQMQQILTVPKGEQQALAVRTAESIDKYTSELAKNNPQLRDMGKDFTAQATKAQALQRVQTAIKDMNERLKVDSVPLALSTDKHLNDLKMAAGDAGRTIEGNQALKKYNDTLIAKANYLGYPARILSDQDVFKYTDEITKITDAYETSQFLGGLKQTYGEHYPKMMSEIISKNPDMKAYAALTYANESVARELVDGIKNKKAIDKEFKDGGAFADSGTLIKSAAAAEMTSFRNIFVNSGMDTSNLTMIQGIQEAVEIKARRDIVNGNKDPVKATKDAYKSVIGDQYHIVESGRSSVLIPRNLGGNKSSEPRRVEAFIDVYSEPQNYRDLNIAIPKKEFAAQQGAKAATKAVLEGGFKEITTEAIKDRYYGELAKRSRWVTTKDQSGVMLMERDPETGVEQPLFDTYGRPIQKSYAQIKDNPPDKVNERFINPKNKQKDWKKY